MSVEVQDLPVGGQADLALYDLSKDEKSRILTTIRNKLFICHP